MIQILNAVYEDLSKVHELTQKCARHMIDNGIFQWDLQYPSLEVLKQDIKLKQLWKFVENNEIQGIIVITEIEDEEYKQVKWLSSDYRNIYIHRLAVLPEYQGMGYAQKLMDYAENYAKSHEYKSIRLDTFSKNPRNQRFYEQRNYKRLGSVYFPNQSIHPFYCYELIIES